MANKAPHGTIQFQPPKWNFNPKLILLAPLALLVLFGALGSFYTVNTESVGIVQRLGRYTTTTQPGLHFKLPYGIDRVTVLPVRRQLKLEFGFATPEATNPFQSGPDPQNERDMVTGDLNAAQVEWIVQYTINSPRDYLFHLRDPAPTLRDLSESVVREVIGDRTVDEVLTIGRGEIGNAIMERLSKVVATLGLGVTIDQIQLTNVHPPGPVQSSFGEVNRAQQEREELINKANGEYNKVIPKARGTAEQRISAAEGYALQRVNEAEGDVARFRELLTQYEKAPEVTRQRLYLETMEKVLPRMERKIILDEDAKQILPLLNLK